MKKGFEIGPSAKESGASSSQMDVIALKQHALQKDTSQGPIPNRREALEQQARHREALEQQTRQREELEQRARQREMYRRVRNYEKRTGVSSAYLTHLAYAEIKVEEAENNLNFFMKNGLNDLFDEYDRHKGNKDKILEKLKDDLKRSKRSYDGAVNYFIVDINYPEKECQKKLNALSQQHIRRLDRYKTASLSKKTNSQELKTLWEQVQQTAAKYGKVQKQLEDLQKAHAESRAFIKEKAEDPRYSQKAFEKMRAERAQIGRSG